MRQGRSRHSGGCLQQIDTKSYRQEGRDTFCLFLLAKIISENEICWHIILVKG